MEEMVQVLRNCKQILKNGFEASVIEENSFMDKFEGEVREYTSNFIKRQFKDINVNLLRRFNKDFKMDSRG